jgi:hypothetical protein
VCHGAGDICKSRRRGGTERDVINVEEKICHGGALLENEERASNFDSANPMD